MMITTYYIWYNCDWLVITIAYFTYETFKNLLYFSHLSQIRLCLRIQKIRMYSYLQVYMQQYQKPSYLIQLINTNHLKKNMFFHLYKYLPYQSNSKALKSFSLVMEIQKIFDQFACQICYTNYQPRAVQPYIICPNHHLVCNLCLSKIIEKKVCPYCKSKIFRCFELSQFKRLFVIKEAVEIIKKRENTLEAKIDMLQIKAQENLAHSKIFYEKMQEMHKLFYQKHTKQIKEQLNKLKTVFVEKPNILDNNNENVMPNKTMVNIQSKHIKQKEQFRQQNILKEVNKVNFYNDQEDNISPKYNSFMGVDGKSLNTILRKRKSKFKLFIEQLRLP